MGKEDRDAWVVKCPKCGRIRESCRHVSADDVRRIVRLLKAGVEVYEKDEALPEEGHVHEPPARPLARAVRPRGRLRGPRPPPGPPGPPAARPPGGRPP